MADNVVITKVARKKMVRARAGDITLSKIVGMAFGDGGVDESGAVIAPAPDQVELTSELFRKDVDGYEVLEGETATVRYKCTLDESELEGEYISEIGLYDEEGDVVCIKTFTRKGKDSDLEMIFSIDDVF